MKRPLTVLKSLVILSLTLNVSLGSSSHKVLAVDLGQNLKQFPYADTQTLPLAIEASKYKMPESSTFNYGMATLPKSFPQSAVVASASTEAKAITALALPQVKKKPFFFLDTLKQALTPSSNKKKRGSKLPDEGSHTPGTSSSAQVIAFSSSAGASPAVAMASINNLSPSSIALPNIWKNGKRPAPTLREQMVIRLIQTTNPYWDTASAHTLARLVIDSGDANRIDYRILASLVATESSFKIDAVSRTGAKGLGQLKDATAQWLGVQDAFNPIDNLNGTAKYLSYLADQFPNDPARAVASYFVGQGNVKREGLNDSAIQYIMKVQRHLDLLLSWGAN